MYHFTALVTCWPVLVYFYSSILVSRARGKFGVKLPAISGNPDFERVFRAQMNTLEWLPIFLPSLWLFAIYIGDGIAAGIGLVWVIGRILYVIGYARAVERPRPGLSRSRRWRRSRCGSARSARSCGGWCMREENATLSTSSLRTQGPIPRVVRWSTAPDPVPISRRVVVMGPSRSRGRHR